MSSFFFFNDTATTEIYTLSLHDALPISHTVSGPFWLFGIQRRPWAVWRIFTGRNSVFQSSQSRGATAKRSEEHTSELQSPCNLVCRLLLEKKKKKIKTVS